jgi:putative transposase
MPRPTRNFEPGGIYHITARGNRKQTIYLTESDYELFLTLLGQVAARLNWRCAAYCLMPNHYHLVTEIREENLSLGLQSLNSRYAQAFNDRYHVSGHLFQGRFHAVMVESDSHLLEFSRYLALNPVRAGLCAHPENWRWGSYRAIAGLGPWPIFLDASRVFEFWGADRKRARRTFQLFVQEGRTRTLADVAA